MTADLPANVHVSTHPCVRAKISQLRSITTDARLAKKCIHDIAVIVGCEALANSLETAQYGQDRSPLDYTFDVERIQPTSISLMPILRSGLAMMDALETLLPEQVPVYHLGLYRDRTTMSAVEYYNNLRSHDPHAGALATASGPSELTILLDPVIATGTTACAAIDTLHEWGVGRIVMVSVISSRDGLVRAAQQWPEGVEIWVGAMDEECDVNGMLKPGLGDVGNRLFNVVGK